jgi:hypothetical protein
MFPCLSLAFVTLWVVMLRLTKHSLSAVKRKGACTFGLAAICKDVYCHAELVSASALTQKNISTLQIIPALKAKHLSLPIPKSPQIPVQTIPCLSSPFLQGSLLVTCT